MVKFFENGYGISVISNGYGSEQGLYECAMLKGDEKKYTLVYPKGTSFQYDVVGWCDEDDVERLTQEIMNYKEVSDDSK